jgi:hypothetical protein
MQTIYQPRQGAELLGSVQMGTAANTSAILTIPAMDWLRISIVVTGYSGNGIVSLQFGGTAGAVDTGNNYLSRWLQSAAGGATFANTANNTQPRMALATAAVVTSRIISVEVMNNATIVKNSTIKVMTNAGNTVTSQPTIEEGVGFWANTTQQIVSLRLIASANNLLAGTGFWVEGMKF